MFRGFRLEGLGSWVFKGMYKVQRCKMYDFALRAVGLVENAGVA